MINCCVSPVAVCDIRYPGLNTAPVNDALRHDGGMYLHKDAYKEEESRIIIIIESNIVITLKYNN